MVALGGALLHITGGRLRGLPASAGGWVAALGFHGGLASVLGLYLVFWVDLTVLQAYLAPSSAPPPSSSIPVPCLPSCITFKLGCLVCN